MAAYCEIDKYASKSYAAIHGVSEELNMWDVTKILPEKGIDQNMKWIAWPGFKNRSVTA